MKNTHKILIVEDHPLFSKGIINALSAYPEYAVLGSIETMEALSGSVKEMTPDILLLDVNVAGVNSFDQLPDIKKRFPKLKVLILTMYLPADLQLGSKMDLIDGYVLKNSGTEILLKALSQIIANEKFWDPHVTRENHHTHDKFTQKNKLSTREMQILQLLKTGISNREIGKQLFISELTVKTHRKNIMSKLNVSSIVALIQKEI